MDDNTDYTDPGPRPGLSGPPPATTAAVPDPQREWGCRCWPYEAPAPPGHKHFANGCDRRPAAPPAVPDSRFREQAAKLLWPFGVPHRLGHEDRERWDRVAQALAHVEARVQAAVNQRAAEETALRHNLHELCDSASDGYVPVAWIRELCARAALASPAPAPQGGQA